MHRCIAITQVGPSYAESPQSVRSRPVPQPFSLSLPPFRSAIPTSALGILSCCVIWIREDWNRIVTVAVRSFFRFAVEVQDVSWNSAGFEELRCIAAGLWPKIGRKGFLDWCGSAVHRLAEIRWLARQLRWIGCSPSIRRCRKLRSTPG